jgi:hypothetical protein
MANTVVTSRTVAAGSTHEGPHRLTPVLDRSS